jgi:hypothetical protein
MNERMTVAAHYPLYPAHERKRWLLIPLKGSGLTFHRDLRSMEKEIVRLNSLASRPPFCIIHKPTKFDPL